MPVDQIVLDAVQRIGTARHTYGTRRMAAPVSRELQTPVNRKKIQRTFYKLSGIESAKTKKDIKLSRKKLFKPTAPNQL